MITTQRSHYLNILAAKNNILLLSDNPYPAFDAVKENFAVAVHHNMQQYQLDNIHATLLHHNINVILLDATSSSTNAKEFYHQIKIHNPRILVISILDTTTAPNAVDMTQNSDTAIFAPFTLQEFKGKLFDVLSIIYTILSIGKAQVSSSTKENDIDDFLNNQAGAVLFIVDQLTEINISLKNGELSNDLLKSISENLQRISDIFSLNDSFKKLIPNFTELIEFIENIKLDELEPSSLKYFDYLANIIEDINVSMMHLFDKKIISDISMCQLSLKKNVELLEIMFNNGTDATSDLEFFYD